MRPRRKYLFGLESETKRIFGFVSLSFLCGEKGRFYSGLPFVLEYNEK